MLGRAITLAESTLPAHIDAAQEIIEQCLPYTGRSIRIGITGVPGVGKSSFIEQFGIWLAGKLDKKVAVLAIDPTSSISKGSILGDKTRMEQLAVHPNAFIRPSPAGTSLGGVARKTREAIYLCEAAGFEIIIVETVGVGQSETAVHSMVDFFLLLMLAGAGDELQGIKRGIMEMADALIITKADGNNLAPAKLAAVAYRNALHLLPPHEAGWVARTGYCSAQTGEGIEEIWAIVEQYLLQARVSGFFEERRKRQSVYWMDETIGAGIKDIFVKDEEVQRAFPKLLQQLKDGEITSYAAAGRLLEIYSKR